jgi:hypothetical protein
MTTEFFSGKPQALKDRLDAIILGGAVTIQVVVTSEKGAYIIIYS